MSKQNWLNNKTKVRLKMPYFLIALLKLPLETNA